MRAEGIQEAVRAAGGAGAFACGPGTAQLTVSTPQHAAANRVLMADGFSGDRGAALRPDPQPHEDDPLPSGEQPDEVDLLRSQHYDLLSVLLGRAPTDELLVTLRALEGDGTALGTAYRKLAEAARATDPDVVSREYFDLFVGLGRGEILPYASYYLTGFLNERPLARVREDMQALGIEAADDLREPEDHVAILCEVMSGLAARRFEAAPGADRRFFDRHLKPFAERFFTDLELANSSRFYRAVGALGRLFIEIETEAFAIEN
jgi:TorA maturation chaperone TorD